jgi:hypothetical protein
VRVCSNVILQYRYHDKPLYAKEIFPVLTWLLPPLFIVCVLVLTVCGGLLTGPNGVIDMRNETRALHWFYTYQHLQCEWNITVRVGRTIAVEFPVFNVPSSDTAHCGENYIMVSHSSGALVSTVSTVPLLLCIPFIFRVEEQQRILCHSYNTSHRTRYFMARLMVSVPWRRRQRWSLKCWFFCRLTDSHGW